MIPCFLSVILCFLGKISCFLAVITCILAVISSILAVISCILAVNHVLLLCFQACKHFFDGEKCVAHCPPPLIYDSEKFEYRRNPDVKYSYGTLCVDKCPCEYPHAYTHRENHTHVHIHSIHIHTHAHTHTQENHTHTHTNVQYIQPILIHLIFQSGNFEQTGQVRENHTSTGKV